MVAEHKPGGLRLYASTDGCLYLDQITALCQSENGKFLIFCVFLFVSFLIFIYHCSYVIFFHAFFLYFLLCYSFMLIDPDSKEKEGGGEWKPLIMLIPLRLGLDNLNLDYVPALKEVFHYPQSLGIIGGRPRSSLYFVGYQGNYKERKKERKERKRRKERNKETKKGKKEKNKRKEKEKWYLPLY